MNNNLPTLVPIVDTVSDAAINRRLVHPVTLSRLLAALENVAIAENISPSQAEQGQWDKDNCADRWE